MLWILSRCGAVVLADGPVRSERDRLRLGGQVSLADRADLADDSYP